MSSVLTYKNIVLCLVMLLCSCAATKNVNKKSKTSKNNSTITKISKSDPFYPLQESMMDLQNQIIELKSQVIEYESKLHTPELNIDLLKLAQIPNLKHEIMMSNGTIIQGTIIFENANQMIVKTQIGQLTIEKEFVVDIREKEPIEPILEFNPSIEIEERINEDNSITYIGEILNSGMRRADFVRVLYHFWADDTAPVYTDSSFISGNNMVYMNGVISDANIEPSQSASFIINITLPDSLEFEYITKDIQWNIFD